MFRWTGGGVPSGALLAVVAHALLAAAGAAQAADTASPNDTARYLAGLLPAETSPLVPLTRQPAWRQHAGIFDAAWRRLDDRQIASIRTWSRANLGEQQAVLYYMFSGPDFLYADAFFPAATTYVLSGLEPVGPVPDVSRLSPAAAAAELGRLRASLETVLSFSFFITKKMSQQLASGPLRGTLPVLYVFLARAGKTIHEVSLVALGRDGKVVSAEESGQRGPASGARITFSGSDGRTRTLYYFSTDLSDGGVRNSGFLEFCEQLGTGDSFVKSASYLLHSGNFSRVRSFLLQHSATVLQDDSGIPVVHFKPEDWQLRAFGSYSGPISIFADRYQAKLRKLYQNGRTGALPFGVGYRWQPRESNLLLAIRGNPKPVQSQ